jgi:hypothetical protein
MSSAEDPIRAGRVVTVEDVQALMGASTPHFALQLRARIRALIGSLADGDPARVLGLREIARLDEIAADGEVRGHHAESGMTPLQSVVIATPDA